MYFFILCGNKDYYYYYYAMATLIAIKPGSYEIGIFT